MRSKEYVLMAHFAVIRFDGAAGACQKSGGPKGGHLKWDFAVKVALDMLILTAQPKAIPQGKSHLDRGSAV